MSADPSVRLIHRAEATVLMEELHRLSGRLPDWFEQTLPLNLLADVDG